MDFPLFSTKVSGVNRSFNLNDPAERKEYFYAKAGKEINLLKNYLNTKTFVGFLLAKKAAGKGTYSKMLTEVLGEDKIALISVGDVVREVHKLLEDTNKEKETLLEIKSFYRGFIPFEEAIYALKNRTVEKTLPTELILSLVKREIRKVKDKAVFIDGFPRTMDQVSYSLYFREIMNLRPDPDFFVLIDVPESVIDERIKYRRVCPLCGSSRNLKLFPTKFVEYDVKEGKFTLKCDNVNCRGYKSENLLPKENDELGIKAIKNRLETDEIIIKRALKLSGVSKILLRNSIPVNKAKNLVDDYEITPEYIFKYNKKKGRVDVFEKKWIVKDDNGVKSFSLLPAPVVLHFIRQLCKVLGQEM